MWSRATANPRIKTKPKKSSLPTAKPSISKTREPAISNDFHGTASIFDLQPKDKSKIKNLIRKVVALDTECKSTEEKAKESQRKLKKQVTALKSQNNQIIKQHSKLRCKFQQSLKLLQSYQVKITQMDVDTAHTQTPTADAKHRKPSADEKEKEKYAQQIQSEISGLKQLILELHKKERHTERQQKRPPPPRPIPQMSQSATESMLYHHIPDNSNSNSKSCFVDEEIEEESSDLQSISPIQTPRSHERPPAPHPYPVKSKTKMTLAQLRKYSLPSSSSASASPPPPPKPKPRPRGAVGKASTLGKDRLSQLLRIQSGNFKKETTKTKTQRAPTVQLQSGLQTSASLIHLNPGRDRDREHTETNGSRDLRRVQSEKAMDAFEASDDDEDRLSHYEGMNLGLSFPKTDDEFSDEEDELMLIQHLNVLPR